MSRIVNTEGGRSLITIPELTSAFQRVRTEYADPDEYGTLAAFADMVINQLERELGSVGIAVETANPHGDKFTVITDDDPAIPLAERLRSLRAEYDHKRDQLISLWRALGRAE